jgi:hypothetical protein
MDHHEFGDKKPTEATVLATSAQVTDLLLACHVQEYQRLSLQATGRIMATTDCARLVREMETTNIRLRHRLFPYLCVNTLPPHSLRFCGLTGLELVAGYPSKSDATRSLNSSKNMYTMKRVSLPTIHNHFESKSSPSHTESILWRRKLDASANQEREGTTPDPSPYPISFPIETSDELNCTALLKDDVHTT